MKDWPYEGFPTGWWMIGWPADFPAGSVRYLKHFGQDIVAYRTESGTLSVADAYCPHYGAHLGFGGRVEGECIVCPWHGWSWDLDGNNTDIPFVEQTNRRAKLRTWEVREVDGISLIWYDAGGAPADYEWPGLPEFKDTEHFYPVHPHCSKRYEPAKVMPQSPMENSADYLHFPHVHGSAKPATFGEWVEDGHYLRAVFFMEFGRDGEVTWMTPDGPEMGEIESEYWGLGLGIARFKVGGRNTTQLVAATPIDAEYSQLFSTVATSREPGDTGDEPTGTAAKWVRSQHQQIANDFTIWENQRYLERPSYVGAEERWMVRLRRHAAQFYPPNDPAAVRIRGAAEVGT